MGTTEPTVDSATDPVFAKALIELSQWLDSPETNPEFTAMKSYMGDVFEKASEERRSWKGDPNLLNRRFTI